MSFAGELTSLVAETTTDNAVKLSWTGTLSYVSVEQSINGTTYTTIATNITDLYYTISDLNTNTLYYFRVTPYSSSDVEGTALTCDVNVPITATITSFYAGTCSQSAIPLYWRGSFYAIQLQYKKSTETDYTTISDKIYGRQHILSNLDEDTYYNIRIKPYYVNGELGDAYSTITVMTDYTPYLTDFSFSEISSKYVVVSWTGEANYIKFLLSSDGGVSYTNISTINPEYDASGEITISELNSYTQYYFAAVPYNYSYGSGTTQTITTKTKIGIDSFYVSEISQEYITLGWSHEDYTFLEIYKSTDGGASYNYLTTLSDVETYTDTSVAADTDYYYYILPYIDGDTTETATVGISSEVLHVLSDYYATVGGEIVNITSYSLDVSFSAAASSFEYAVVQLSTDGGTSYVDVSFEYQNPAEVGSFTHTITTDISYNTYYTVRVLPYGRNQLGSNSFIDTVCTAGTIDAIYMSISATTVDLSWSGAFVSSVVERATDAAMTDISYISVANTYTDIFDTSLVSHYYRVRPVNSAGDIAAASLSPVVYNPVVSTLYYSDVSSSTATLSWSGNYSRIAVQTASAAAGTYSTVATTTGNTITFSTSAPKYARVVPILNGVSLLLSGGDVSGQTTTFVYNATVSTFSVAWISNTQIALTISGVAERMALYWGSSDTPTTAISEDISATTHTTVYEPTGAAFRTSSYYFKLLARGRGLVAGAVVDTSGYTLSLRNPAISTFYLSNISKNTSSMNVKLNWAGAGYTKLAILYSTNDKTYSTLSTITNTTTTTYSYTTDALGTTYYKIQPYSTFWGVSTEMVYIPYITDISVSSITYDPSDTMVLSVAGAFDTYKIKTSTDNITFVDFSTNVVARDVAITSSDLTSGALQDVPYYFYAIPYATTGTATGAKSSTVNNGVIDYLYISSVSQSNYFTLTWTGYYTTVDIQYSADNSTFTDLYTGISSSTTKSKTIYETTGTTSYYRLIPYTSTTECIASDTIYNPSVISSVDSVATSEIGISWTGTFDYIKLQYSKTTETGTYYDISKVIVSDVSSYTITTDDIAALDTDNTSYYVKLTPYATMTNRNGVVKTITGAYSISFVSNISSITLSDITSTGATLSWNGTFTRIDVQQSTDNSTFTTLESDITDDYSLAITTSGYTTKYYRIVSYATSSGGVGMPTSSVYIPTIASFSISSVSQYEMTIDISSGSVYDIATLQYSKDNSTYIDLKRNITENTITIDTSVISTIDAKTTTYYFKLIPYTYGYADSVKDVVITGLTLGPDYNASVSSFYVENVSDNSTNQLTVYYTGTYETATLKYKKTTDTNYTVVSIDASNSGTETYTTISSLVSDTSYQFVMTPRNSNDLSGVDTTVVYKKTISLLNNLNPIYSEENSTATAIYFSWTYNGYSKLRIYNENDELIALYSGGTSPTTYYLSSGTETLISDTDYTYTIKVYDYLENVETTTLTAYTTANSEIDITYTPETDGSITLDWPVEGYTLIQIHNYTLHGSSPPAANVVVYTITSETATYNSYTDGADTLSYNTKYVYLIKLTSSLGTTTNIYTSTYTMSDISAYTINTIKPNTVDISWSGYFDYVVAQYSSTSSTLASGLTEVASENTTGTTISSLIPNTYYYMRLCPVNLIEVSGTKTDIFTVNTKPTFPRLFWIYDKSYNFATIASDAGLYDTIRITVSTDASFSTYLSYIDLSCTFAPPPPPELAFDPSLVPTSPPILYHTITDLSTDVLYYFRGTPYNITGAAGWTIDTSGQTLGQITELSISDVAATYLTASWMGTYTLAYLEESVATDGSFVMAARTDASRVVLTERAKNTVFYYRVRPLNAMDESGDIVSDICACTLATVEDLSLVSQDASGIYKITWDGSFTKLWIYSLSGQINLTYYEGTRTTGEDISSNITVRDDDTIFFIPYNQFDVSSSPTTVYLPYIYDVSAANYDSSSVIISWMGSYSWVSIYIKTDDTEYSDYTYYTQTSAPTYHARALTSNKKYYFKMVPARAGLGEGFYVADVSAYTWARVSSFVATPVDTSAVRLVWDGSFDSVNIWVSDVSGSYTGAATTFASSTRATVYSGLSAGNTTYYFKIVPTGTLGANAAGGKYDVSATTYASITQFITTKYDSSAVSLTWDGSFSSVQIWVSDVSGSYTGTATTYGTTTRTTIFRGLAYGNTTYYFKIVPTGALGTNTVATIQDISGTTYARATKLVAATYDSSAATLTWDGSFSSVRIYVSDVSGTYNSAVYKEYSASTRTAIFGDLWYGNTNYYFKIVPTGALGTTTDPAAILSDVSAYTWARATKFSAVALDSSAITLVWDGSFSSVDIWISDVSGTYSGTATTYTTTTRSVIWSGLAYGNTQYYFKLVPSGTLGATIKDTGAFYVDVSDITYARIKSFVVDTFDSSAVKLTWDGSFSSVDIWVSDICGTYTGTATTYSATTKTTIFRGLWYGNTQYFFKIVPNGAKGATTQDTGAFYTNVANYTYARTTKFIIETFDSSAVRITWDGSFSLVYIYMSDVSGTYSINPTQYSSDVRSVVYNGLPYGNTTYYFRILPFGTLGITTKDTGAFYTDISGTTYARATKLTAAAFDGSAATLTWDGSFSSVRIYVSDVSGTYNSAVYKDYSATIRTATYDGLWYGNTKYFFKIEPTGALGTTTDPAAILSDVSAYTYPRATKLVAATFDGSAATLTWDGSFSSVRIYVSDISGTYNTAVYKDFTNTRTATYNGLWYGNTNYYFRIVPNGVLRDLYTHPAEIVSDVSAYTYPRATKLVAAAFDGSAATLTWDGSFSSVRIYVSDVSGTYSVYKDFDATTRTATYNGLWYGNTNYYFRVVPNGVLRDLYTHPAEIVSDVSAYTYPRATKLTAAAFDSSAATLTWDGSFSSVRIYATDISGTYNTAVYNDYSTTTRSAVFGGLSYGNTNYYFRVVPNGVLRDLYTHPAAIVSDVSAYTWARATRLTATAFDSSAATLTWDGSFNSMFIYVSDISNTYTTAYGEYTTKSALIQNLTYGNTTYYFRAIPAGVLGTTTAAIDPSAIISNITTLTYPTVSKLVAKSYDSSAVRLTWDGSFSSVRLYSTTDAGTYRNVYTTVSYPTRTALITDLSYANKKYYFKIVPNNATGDGIAILDASDITYPTISYFYPSDVGDTRATLAFDGSFDYLDISVNNTTNAKFRYVSGIKTSGTDISGLDDNAYITATATAYNAAGYNVSEYYTFLTNTSAFVDTFTASPVMTSNTYSGIYLQWTSSNYEYMIVQYNSSGEIFGATDTFVQYNKPTLNATITDLSANTTYYFKITPYSVENSAGDARTTSVLTYGKMTAAKTTYYDTSAIRLDWSGNYESVNVYVSTVASSYPTTYTNYAKTTTYTVYSNLSAGTTYYFKFAPVNTQGEGLYKTDVSGITYPKLTTFLAAPLDGSAITLTWDGSFATVSVWMSDTSGSAAYTGSAATYTYPTRSAVWSGLTYGNTKYYFKITPLNEAGYGANILDVSAYTYPRATKLVAAALDGSAVSLAWDGSFSSVRIYVSDVCGNYSSVYKDYTSTTRTTVYNGLWYGNTKYYFKIVPMGVITETKYTAIPVYISDTTYITFTSNSQTVSTGTNTYSYVNGSYEIKASSYVGSNYVYLIANNSQSSSWHCGFTSNSYDIDGNNLGYNQSPYSSSGVYQGGTSGSTSSNYWKTTIGGTDYAGEWFQVKLPYYLKLSDFSFYVGNSSYPTRNPKILYIAGSYDGSTWTMIYSNTNGTSAQYTSDVVNTSNYYSYFRFVINETTGNDVANYSKLSMSGYISIYTHPAAIISDVSAYTYPRATKLVAAALDSSAATLTWDGSFSSVRIYATDVCGNYAASYKDFSTTTRTAVYDGLWYGNTKYFFRVVPNGVLGDLYTHPAAIISDVSAYTYPRATKLTAAALDGSAVSLVWDGSFSSVRIYATDVCGNYAASYKDFGATTRAATYNGLWYGNTKYFFRIVPNGVLGDLYTHPAAIISDVSAYTYPRATKLTAATRDSSSATLTWDGSFSSVRIYVSDVSGTYSVYKDFDATTRTATYNGLWYGNTNYFFKIVPNGVLRDLYTHPTSVVSDVSAYTWARATKFAATPFDSSGITLVWDGSYSSMTVFLGDASFQNLTNSSLYNGISSGSSSSVLSAVASSTATYTSLSGWTISLTATDTITGGSAVVGYGTNTTYATSTGWAGYYWVAIGMAYNGTNTTGSLAQSVYLAAGTYTFSFMSCAAASSTYSTFSTVLYVDGVAAATQTYAANQTIYTTSVSFTVSSYKNVSIEIRVSNTASTTNSPRHVAIGNILLTRDYVSSVSNYLASQTYTYPTRTAVWGGLEYGNTRYFFKTVPSGVLGTTTDVGAILTDVSAYTYARATKLVAAPLDSSAATLTWDGSFTAVRVYATDVCGNYGTTYTEFTGATTRTGVFGGLKYGNTKYFFRVVPVGVAGVATDPAAFVSDVSAYTYARSTKFVAAPNPYDSSSVKLTWDGSFSSVRVYATDVSGSYGTTYTEYTGRVGTYTGLTYGNTKYFFKIVPYGILGATTDPAAIISDVSAYTYPRITSFARGTLATDAIQLTWDGSFSKVWVYKSTAENSFSTYTEVAAGTNYTTFSSLSTNTKYYFRITPVGYDGSGVSVDISQTTLGTVSSATATVYDNSSITLAWSGSFDSVLVDLSGFSAITYPSSTTSTLYTGLRGNATYTFAITPLNVSKDRGTAYRVSPSSYTTADLSDVLVVGGIFYDVIVDPSIDFFMATYTAKTPHAYYTDISYYDFTSPSVSTNSRTSNPTTAGWTITGHNGSTGYYFLANGTSQTKYTLPSAYTQYASFTLNNTTMTMYQDITLGTGTYTLSFYYASWTSVTNYVYYQPTITVSLGGNTIYTRAASSVDTGAWLLLTSSEFTISTAGTYTLLFTFTRDDVYWGIANITGLYLNKIISEYTSFVWSGVYQSVGLYTCDVSGTTTGTVASYIAGNSYTYSGTISSDSTTYYYKVVPTNMERTSTTKYMISSVTTAATLTTAKISWYDSSAIKLIWDGSFETVGITVNSSTTYYANTVKTATYTGLSSNTKYTYTIAAINPAGTTSVSTDVSATTLGYVSYAYSSLLDASSMTIYITGTYSTAYITANNTTKSTSGTECIFDGLRGNATYSFKVTPYNSVDVSNASYTTATSDYTYPDFSNILVFVSTNYDVIVDPSIHSFIASTWDTSSVYFTWSGVYQYVSIYQCDSTGTTIGAATDVSYATTTSTIISGLSSNKLYYFKIVPTNMSRTSKYYMMASAYTTAKLNYVSAIGFDTSSIMLSWDGSYNAVNVYVSNYYDYYNTVEYNTYYGSTGTAKCILVNDIVIINGSSQKYYFKVEPLNDLSSVGTVVSNITAGIYYYKFENGDLNSISETQGFYRTLFNYSDFSSNTIASASSMISSTTAKYGSYSYYPYISSSSSASLIMPSNTLTDAGLTFATWVYMGSSATSGSAIRWFDFAATTTTYNLMGRLIYNSGLQIAYYVDNNTTASPNVSYTATGYTLGTWAHVAIVHSGNIVYVYYNGTLAQTSTSISYPTVTTRSYNKMGISNSGTGYSSQYIFLDDFVCYNQAFNATQISSLYSSRLQSGYSGTILPLNLITNGDFAATDVSAATTVSSLSYWTLSSSTTSNTMNSRLLQPTQYKGTVIGKAIYSTSCTSLSDWTYRTGVSVSNEMFYVKSQDVVSDGGTYTSYSYDLSGHAYVNVGQSFLNKTVKFDYYADSSGCPSIVFAADLSGTGNSFRIETRSDSSTLPSFVLIKTATWTKWGYFKVLGTPKIALKTWYTIYINISNYAVANANVYNRSTNALFASYTNIPINSCGTYLGLECDGGGGEHYFDNISVYESTDLPPKYTQSTVAYSSSTSNTATLTQSVNLKATKYKLQFYASGRYSKLTGTYGSNTIFSDVDVGGDGWKLYSYTFTPSSAGTYDLALYNTYYTSKDISYSSVVASGNYYTAVYGGYINYVFYSTTGTNTLTVTLPTGGTLQMKVLVVGGGAGGAFRSGGGAGGVFQAGLVLTQSDVLTISVGAGGSVATSGSTTTVTFTNASFNSTKVISAGGGGTRMTAGTSITTGFSSGGSGGSYNDGTGASGGSGSGVSIYNTLTSTTTSFSEYSSNLESAGYGSSGTAGGNGSSDRWAGGGGGGAYSAGSSATGSFEDTLCAGNGGTGIRCTIGGIDPTYYWGGGGGGGLNTSSSGFTTSRAGNGGLGGGGGGHYGKGGSCGGSGIYYTVSNGTDGTDVAGAGGTNTGGGGGAQGISGAAGGSGIVIIAVPMYALDITGFKLYPVPSNVYNYALSINSYSDASFGSSYTYYVFKSTSTIYTLEMKFNDTTKMHIFAVGGGGAGGKNGYGGGGGGGAVVKKSLTYYNGGYEKMTISVGAGGTATYGYSYDGSASTVSFSNYSSYNVSATGGGRGGSSEIAANSGGSGGGSGTLSVGSSSLINDTYTTTAHRYIKLTFTATKGSSSYIQFSELYFYTSGNIRLYPTSYKTNSTVSSGYGADKAFDGNSSTYFSGTFSNPTYIIMDFGTTVTPNRFGFTTSPNNEDYDPKSWKIYFSNNADSYTYNTCWVDISYSQTNYTATSSRSTFCGTWYPSYAIGGATTYEYTKYGNSGALGYSHPTYGAVQGGGGGGAGTVGNTATGSTTLAGDGGDGIRPIDIDVDAIKDYSPYNTYYWAGGGGGAGPWGLYKAGNGGKGGGGSGGTDANPNSWNGNGGIPGTAGTGGINDGGVGGASSVYGAGDGGENTGSGGGGAGARYKAGSGGSGIVIVAIQKFETST